MSAAIKLSPGDAISICERVYILIRRVGGGCQFKTWLVERQDDGHSYVAKITTIQKRVLRELKAYLYLKMECYPERYYSEFVIFDYEAYVIRNHSRIGRKQSVILLKYLDHDRFNTLKNYLDEQSGQIFGKEKNKIVGKIKRRVEELHALGVSHGDLHKDNIMIKISRKGSVTIRLIDFGSSCIQDDTNKQRDLKSLSRITQAVLNS